MKKLRKNWALVGGGLFLVILLALFLRTFKLNLIPVFADEAIYVRWAQVMRAEPSLRFLPLSDGKQPLFMWSVIPALKAVSDPLVAGRLVSVFTGIGTLVGVFGLSFILFSSQKKALLSSLLYALSPFAMFFDRMALVDSMLSMFGVWTVILFILAIKNLRFDFALLAGFSLGGAMLTKSPAIFFAFLLPTLLIFLPFSKKKGIKLNILKGILLLTTTVALGYGIYNILRLGPNFHMVGSRNYDYVHPYSHIFENAFDPFVGHIKSIIKWFGEIGPVAVIIMAFSGAVVNFSKFKKEIIVLIVWAVFPLLVQAEFAKVLTTRYIFFTIPYVFVLASSILNEFKNKKHLYAVYVLIAFFAVHSFLFYIPFFNDPATASWPEREGYMANWTAGTGIKEAAQIIKQKRDEGVSVVVGTEGYFGTLPDGLQIYLEKEQNIVVLGVGLGLNQVPLELKAAKEAGNTVFLVANSSRLNFSKSFEEHGLKVVAEFEKAPRDEGSHNYVEYGPKDTFYLFEIL